MNDLFDPVVVLSAARTPTGKMNGCLKSVSSTRLGATVVRAVVRRAGLKGTEVDRVILGSVLTAGQGQAPARQAARGAGLDDSVQCTTVNRVCGSAMEAVILAHDALVAGSARLVVAGGMESMSNAPFLLSDRRRGIDAGSQHLQDHIFVDGLQNADDHCLMGYFADECARTYPLTRAQQDDYARGSLRRAWESQINGRFEAEIEPVGIENAGSVTEDELPDLEAGSRLRTLKPVFSGDGSVTAANSSGMSDGASALLLARQSVAAALGARPVARIIAHAGCAGRPADFPLAPVEAIRRVLRKLGRDIGQIDLFEINEAFAVVALVAAAELGIPPDRLNVNGGACALGHPLGSSAARILVTLISALEQRNLKRGIAAVCIGGGEASAVAVERP